MSSHLVKAQEETAERLDARTIPYLSVSYQFFAPGGDLADRFGVGNIIGGDFNVKLENNLEFGVGGGFIFGNQVNDAAQMLHGMRTDNNQILDDNYKYAEVFFFQRGWKTGATLSYILPVLDVNEDSGLKLGLGLGYMEHWIRIEHQENMIPQLDGDYKSYYDRKSGGLYLEQFIGWTYFNEKGLANFHGGFEFRQGFNQELRSYNIDDMAPVSGSRVDLYMGVKIAWNILFAKRKADNYYYN